MRDALISGAKQSGRAHPDLLGDPVPAEVAHVWDWFKEIKAARSNSGFGVSPVSYSEMLAWATLTGRAPSPFEVQLLRDVDLVYINIAMSRASEARKTRD